MRKRYKENQFTLFKRGKVWYYWTYDSNGKRHRYSSGETRKTEAFDVCSQLQAEKRLIPDNAPVIKRASTLTEYGKDFWNYDSCPVIQSKLMRGGRFGVESALQNQSLWNRHIEPYFHNRPFDLTSGEIFNWLVNLPKTHNITKKTANNAFGVLSQMLDQMVLDGYIKTNPADKVKRLIVEKNSRAAFTLEQVQALFSRPFDNDLAHIALYLGAKTGMRLGEIRALTVEQVFPTHIYVNASWAKKEGRKCTKSGFDRTVPITKEIYDKIMRIAPPEGGLIFTLTGEKPICDSFIGDRLKKRMDEINKERGELFFDYNKEGAKLSFHSFRHFIDTRLCAVDMSPIKIQAIIGHEDDSMTEHYAHLNVEDLKTFREVQSMIDIA